MRPRLTAALLALGSLLAVAAPAATAAPAAPAATAAAAPQAKTHSRVVTYYRDRMQIERLEADVHPAAHGRLKVHLSLAFHARNSALPTRYVHVGRCVKAPAAAPNCPDAAIVEVPLPAGGGLIEMNRTVTVATPPRAADALTFTVTKSRRAPSRAFFRADGQLLLTGGAWHGTGAGGVYGMRLPASDLRAERLHFDVPVSPAAPDRAYIYALWTGEAAPGAPTTIAPCTAGQCTERPLAPSRSRSGRQLFGARFDFTAGGADAVRLRAVDASGAELLVATLPWPR